MSESTAVAAPASGQPPDLATLTRRLRVALGDDKALLLDRHRNAHQTTFPADILTCQLGDGTVLRLFCKYESGASDGSHGHRGGVRYEADVYRHVLAGTGLSIPRFYGAWADATGSEALLLIEYLEDAIGLHKSPDWPALMVRAAMWIARFQLLVTQHHIAAVCPASRRYGRDYYLGWSRRAADHVARAGLHYPWFEPLRDGFERRLGVLTGADLVPVHGEYYPQTVLVQRGRIRPIDWESAGLAAGEVDLASLVERWPPDVSDACRDAYARTRWPAGAPSNFSPRLDLARTYLHMRWLATDAFLASPAPFLWRFDELRSIGERLGLRYSR